MGNHHKTNYSKVGQQAKEETLTVVEPAEEKVEETVVTETEVKNPVPVEEPVEEVKPNTGIVVDCMKLRVRKNPNTYSGVLCEIPADTKVIIDLDKSTVQFYKVTTEAGVEGYCMKKFIAMI